MFKASMVLPAPRGTPAKIFWLEGSAKDLASITNVKIASAGKVLCDGELNKNIWRP